jgi:hypothetical protein
MRAIRVLALAVVVFAAMVTTSGAKAQQGSQPGSGSMMNQPGGGSIMGHGMMGGGDSMMGPRGMMSGMGMRGGAHPYAR